MACRDWKKSIEYFRTAIDLDPNYAPAFAALSEVVAIAGSVVQQGSMEDVLQQAKKTALQALKLDPTSSSAYSSLGFIQLLFERNWQEAEKNLREALRLNPSNTSAYQWYSLYLSARGRHEEAITTIGRAAQIDPVSPLIRSLTGLAYYFARDYERAMAEYQRTLELNPNDSQAYYLIAMAHVAMQESYYLALRAIQKSLELSPEALNLTECLGYIYALTGDRKAAIKIAEELHEKNYGSGLIWIALGDTDKAFAGINHWLDNRTAMVLLKVAPWYDPIRQDSRFDELLREVGLDE